MGYDLYNSKGGYFRWGFFGFSPVLTLAIAHGWVPMGTLPPYVHLSISDTPAIVEDATASVSALLEAEGIEAEEGTAFDRWPGVYCSNDGQIVRAADAIALAGALRRAATAVDLRKIERKTEGDQPHPVDSDLANLIEHALRDDTGSISQGVDCATLQEYLGLLDAFIDDDRSTEYMRKFADFCEQGAFSID